MITGNALTAEEREIDEAMDAHLAALNDEMTVMKYSFIMNISGFVLTIFTESSTFLGRLGFALLMTSLVGIVSAMLLRIRTIKKREEAKRLVGPYMRKKALPFYQELTELFADKPGVHIHLEENGRITVTDNRKKED